MKVRDETGNVKFKRPYLSNTWSTVLSWSCIRRWTKKSSEHCWKTVLAAAEHIIVVYIHMWGFKLKRLRRGYVCYSTIISKQSNLQHLYKRGTWQSNKIHLILINQITEPQFGTDLLSHLYSRKCQLEQVTVDCIQAAWEYLQRWRFHSTPCPVWSSLWPSSRSVDLFFPISYENLFWLAFVFCLSSFPYQRTK